MNAWEKGGASSPPSETAPTSPQELEEMSSEQFSELLNPILIDAQQLAIRTLGPSRAQHAEDVVQTSIVKAFAHRASFIQGSNFKNWFLRIIQNTALSHHRRLNTHSHQSIERATEDKIPLPIREDNPSLTVEELLGELQEGARVREAIQDINPEGLKTFLLVYVDGLTYDEAATRLGVQIGTVMSRLSRTRQAILKALETNAPDVVEYHNSRRERTALKDPRFGKFKT